MPLFNSSPANIFDRKPLEEATHVLESVCRSCGLTVAVSHSRMVLNIAEGCHICVPKRKTKVVTEVKSQAA